jgi:hypothetical protein
MIDGGDWPEYIQPKPEPSRKANERASMSEETKTFEVSVVVFREDSAFTAVALEMDVRGYGPTSADAIADLMEMLEAQVNYAVEMGHPETVWHRAEEQYWSMFEDARRQRFVANVMGIEPPTDPFADMIPLPLLAPKHREDWIAARA